MCIIFLYHNNNSDGRYRLVLAANRDEYMNRPAKPADFHPDFPDILSGLDMEAGVEGGTWLGVTKSGKFSAITNVLVHTTDMSKLPRGSLVMEYLKGDKKPLEYLRGLQDKEHREYNLVVGECDEQGKINIAFHSNCFGEVPRALTNDTNVIACTKIDGNWRKIQRGRAKFQEILEHSQNTTTPDEFSDILLDSLLSDTTILYPDDPIKEQCKGKLSDHILQKYCSVKIVGLPGYGTRMQTVVLIDKYNRMYFTEKSLRGSDPEKDWMKNSYNFPLNL